MIIDTEIIYVPLGLCLPPGSPVCRTVGGQMNQNWHASMQKAVPSYNTMSVHKTLNIAITEVQELLLCMCTLAAVRMKLTNVDPAEMHLRL